MTGASTALAVAAAEASDVALTPVATRVAAPGAGRDEVAATACSANAGATDLRAAATGRDIALSGRSTAALSVSTGSDEAATERRGATSDPLLVLSPVAAAASAGATGWVEPRRAEDRLSWRVRSAVAEVDGVGDFAPAEVCAGSEETAESGPALSAWAIPRACGPARDNPSANTAAPARALMPNTELPAVDREAFIRRIPCDVKLLASGPQDGNPPRTTGATSRARRAASGSTRASHWLDHRSIAAIVEAMC